MDILPSASGFSYFRYLIRGQLSLQLRCLKSRLGSAHLASSPSQLGVSLNSSAGFLVQRGSNKNLGVTLPHLHPFSLRRWLIILFSLRPKNLPMVPPLTACTLQNSCYSSLVCLSSTGPRAELTRVSQRKQAGTEDWGWAELYLC